MRNRTSELIERLQNPAAYPHVTSRIEVIETHISFVILTGDYAYKIKKDVRLPFVDFSTIERRRYYCDRELTLNRRTAAELYLDVVPIGGTMESPIVGETPAIEFAVKMRQFDRSATADQVLARDALTAEALRTFAARLTRFHASLDAVESGSPVRRMHDNLNELMQQLPAMSGSKTGYWRESLNEVRRWVEARDLALEQTFAERIRAGFARDCHGDLHLGNIAVIESVLVPFDCLEFDDDLRRIDVADEIAFLVMDLMAKERDDLAYAFLDACLQESGDYECLALLLYYCVHRALVRCKVRRLSRTTCSNDETAEKWPFLELASRLARPVTPLLIITMGLSGSGKTTVTDALIGLLPAVRVRSDVERKRIHGLTALESSHSTVGGGIYDERTNEATYERLRRAAKASLAGGINVIVDATFLEESNRKRFRDLAATCGARFVILRCTAPESILRTRVERRRSEHDQASEARTDVLEQQLRKAQPPGAAERAHTIDVDTTRALDASRLVDEINRQPWVSVT